MTKREEKGIADVCLFTVMLYVKAWFQAPHAPSASLTDLQLLKDIITYRQNNAAVAEVALKKISGYLWYLSEELVAFAFFDDRVSVDTKRLMVTAVHKTGPENPPKRAVLEPALISSKQLEDFVTENTKRFFDNFGIPADFLERDVDTWPTDEAYMTAKATASNCHVVNDIAERGVALMDEFNKLHTNDKQQKQYLMLVVKEYRQRYLNRNKTTLMQ